MNRTLTHLAIAGALLALSIAGYVFAYMFVDSAGAKVAGAQQEIEAKSRESQEIRKASTALAALADSEGRVREYFVSTEGIVPFLEEVTSTGSALGSSVEVVSVTEAAPVEGRTFVTLALRISGSFSSVMRTVGALEFAPYDITLTNLSLDAGGAEGGAWSASAQYQVGTKTP